MGLSVKSPQKLGSPHLEFQIKSYAIYRAAAQGRFRAECVNFQFGGSSYILESPGERCRTLSSIVMFVASLFQLFAC